MTAHTNARRRRGGFSLVELLLAVGLSVTMLGTVAAVAVSSAQAYHNNQFHSLLESRSRRVLARIAGELWSAQRGGLWPDPSPPTGSDRLNYQRMAGFAGGLPVWGTAMRLEFRYDPAELDDGVDNDGDGLVDEGRLVWTRDPGLPTAQDVVWAQNVCEYLEGEVPDGVLDENGNGLIDERGISFAINGDTLTVRLSIQAVDARGQVVVKTAQTSILLRND